MKKKKHIAKKNMRKIRVDFQGELVYSNNV